MKQKDIISPEDWEKIYARLHISCDNTLDLYVMLANSLGRSDPLTKRAWTIRSKIIRLKGLLRQLEKQTASTLSRDPNDYFKQKKGQYVLW